MSSLLQAAGLWADVPCLVLLFKLFIRVFFPYAVTWRRDQSRDKTGMGDRASPMPGGSTGRLLEVVGGVGMGSCGGFPVLWAFRCLCREGQGSAMAGGCCKEVPGAVGMELPRVRASWQQLQRA